MESRLQKQAIQIKSTQQREQAAKKQLQVCRCWLPRTCNGMPYSLWRLCSQEMRSQLAEARRTLTKRESQAAAQAKVAETRVAQLIRQNKELVGRKQAIEAEILAQQAEVGPLRAICTLKTEALKTHHAQSQRIIKALRSQIHKVEVREASRRKGAASIGILKDNADVKRITDRFEERLREQASELAAAEECAAETRKAELATFQAQQQRTATAQKESTERLAKAGELEVRIARAEAALADEQKESSVLRAEAAQNKVRVRATRRHVALRSPYASSVFIVGVCDVFRIRWSQVTIEALQEQLKAGQAREEKAAKLMANEVQQRTKDTAALRACEADAAELRKRIGKMKLELVDRDSQIKKAKGECTKLKIVSKLQSAAARSAKLDGEAKIKQLREQLVAATTHGASTKEALEAAAAAAKDEQLALSEGFERRIREIEANVGGIWSLPCALVVLVVSLKCLAVHVQAEESTAARRAEQEAAARIEAALAAQLAAVGFVCCSHLF